MTKTIDERLADIRAQAAARDAAIDRVIRDCDLKYSDDIDSLHGEEVCNAISLHASSFAPAFVQEAVAEDSDDDLRELLAAVATGDPEAGDLITDLLVNYGRKLLDLRLLETEADGEPDDAADVDAAGRAREARAINAERGL